MKKALGICALLVFVYALASLLNPDFLSTYNIQNTLRRTSLFGILSIGAALVIITGGIDLSIGSVICLVGCLLPWLLTERGWPVACALPAAIGVAAAIGLLHGILITKLGLQPFVVTLCGLLFYRGFARWLTRDQTQGFGGGYSALRWLATGKPFSISIPDLDQPVSVPMPFLIFLAIALLAGAFLNLTVYGRYLLALGRNEQAARYSGIQTERMVVAAYVLCSLLAGIGGILFALDVNSMQPATHGNFYELYAIAAAVLGGCSLRGGEGSVLGVVIGAAVMRVLYNSINLLQISTTLEFAIIGAVILAGVMADELIRRIAARRRSARQAARPDQVHP